jgi:hypothetical protein
VIFGNPLSDDLSVTTSKGNDRPLGILQYIFGLCERLFPLTTTLIRRIFTKVYVSLHYTSTHWNAFKRARLGCLSSPGMKSLVRRRTYRIGLKCTALYLILSLSSPATAQLLDGGSHAGNTLALEANSGTSQPFDWESFGVFFGGSIMFLFGGLRMACNRMNNGNRMQNRNRAHNNSSLRSLKLSASLTAGSSVAWTAVAYTVDASHKPRYLGLTAWCMCTMAYQSEPFPGVTPQDRKILSTYHLGGPLLCLAVAHYLFGGIDQEKLGYLPITFTVWWIALDIFTHIRLPPQSTNVEAVDEEHGDIALQDMSDALAAGANGDGDSLGPPSFFTGWWNALDILACIGLSPQSANVADVGDADEEQDHNPVQDSSYTPATGANGNGDTPGPLPTTQQPIINGLTPAPVCHRRPSPPPVFELGSDSMVIINDHVTAATTTPTPEGEAFATVVPTTANEQINAPEQVVAATRVRVLTKKQRNGSGPAAFDSYANGQTMQAAAGVIDTAGQIPEGCLEMS